MPRPVNRPLPPPLPEISRPVRLARLGQSGPTRFAETATDPERLALARLFGARAVDRFRFEAELRPLPGGGWALDGRLLATVIQSCVVTLAPVAQKLDEPMRRRFLPDGASGIDIDPEEEDDIDPLADEIDLGAIAIETAALALDPYPRAPKAELVLPAAEDSAPNPFAVLATLKPDPEPGG